MSQATGPSRARRLLPGIAMAVALVVAACSGASAVATPAASLSAASPAIAGPTSFAAWVEHQGFGQQIGPSEVRRQAAYISDHHGVEDPFDLEQETALVAGIVDWLDAHPATDCWADYHAQVRASMVTVRDGWLKARPIVANGGFVPDDVVTGALAAATAASDLPAPANCP